MKNIKKILDEQILSIHPPKEKLDKIEIETKKFIADLKKKIKNYKAEIFVGGSIAKGTLIKKDKYDVDIFVRFDKKYKDKEVSEILAKILEGKRIHGSRDYFQIQKENLIFEIVPTIKIKKPEEARNVTDLSYFHVKYIKNKIKGKKNLAQEIMLAKAFCYANSCYGAESYIKGFSGYALELLVSYYGSFLKFMKTVKDKEKIILDPEKHYKNKNEVLLELNESKLQSPIIFVDPTYKQRNALAALSEETFEKFKNICNNFLKNPGKSFFGKKDFGEELKKYKNLIIIETKTQRQKGDIGGSKLKKFYEYLCYKLKRDFEIQKSEFEYNEDKNAGKNYFVLKQKSEIILEGPPINNKQNTESFKKKHKNTYTKKGRIYAKERTKTFKEFFTELKNDKTLKEMEVSEVRLVKHEK